MLAVRNVSKIWPNGVEALRAVDLCVERGEILAVLGGSGCGKSTLLRIAAGLEVPTTGQVELAGSPTILAPRPEIGVVFQEPRLMPWLTVRDNVALAIRNLPRHERGARVTAALDRVGLSGFAGAWPRELSGGMAQRAALARALVAQPSVLLLDEPFSALDALTRADLQDHLIDLWSTDRPTLVVVTHDVDEALYLADRIVVMDPRPGRVRAVLVPKLPRPRPRIGAETDRWKARLLEELGRGVRTPSGEDLVPAAVI